MLKLNLVQRIGSAHLLRRKTLLKRFVILTLAGIFIAQIFPTLADEQQRAAELINEVESSTVSGATPSPGLSQEPAPAPAPTALQSETPSTPVEEDAPPKALPMEGIVAQLPIESSVDPRAQVTLLPRISFTGPQYLILCINARNAVVDVMEKGQPNNASADNLYVSGDLTSNLVLSGEPALVTGALNSKGGMRISSLGGFLSSAALEFEAVATDKFALDPSLCQLARANNRRALTFKAIGLGLEVRKGEVTLKR